MSSRVLWVVAFLAMPLVAAAGGGPVHEFAGFGIGDVADRLYFCWPGGDWVSPIPSPWSYPNASRLAFLLLVGAITGGWILRRRRRGRPDSGL